MDLSIVIPTFNEIENIPQLIERIMLAFAKKDIQYEICFIDDSTDQTPILLERMSQENKIVRYLHRHNGKGLGTAVVQGFHLSKGEYLIVMDADLQHPPELLPEIFNHLKTGVDLVLPTRFSQGGSDGGLNIHRKMISYVARKLGQLCIKHLRDITDCTSGFFGLKRTVIEGISLDPTSWKVLIEILVKGRYQTKKEVAYSFVARDSGTSKMNLKEQWNYLWHIFCLFIKK